MVLPDKLVWKQITASRARSTPFYRSSEKMLQVRGLKHSYPERASGREIGTVVNVAWM